MGLWTGATDPNDEYPRVLMRQFFEIAHHDVKPRLEKYRTHSLKYIVMHWYDVKLSEHDKAWLLSATSWLAIVDC